VTFRSVYTDGAQCFYFMDDGTNFECGVGTVHYGTPNFLSRDTVISTSAGTTLRINFSGALDVYNEVPGERMGYRDPTGVFRTPGAFLDPGAGGVPIGAMSMYCGGTLPTGWLWCNGSAVSRVTYARLFALIGTFFGPGDGSSTFNPPDMRGRMGMGVDGFAGMPAARLPWATILGGGYGDWQMAAHSHGLNWSDPGHGHLVSDPSHTHAVNDPQHAHVYLDSRPGGSGEQVGTGSAAGDTVRTTGFAPTNIGLFQAVTGIGIVASGSGISASVQVAGGGVAGYQNLPPALAVYFIIYSGNAP
jgi:microcystin-dependent protein